MAFNAATTIVETIFSALVYLRLAPAVPTPVPDRLAALPEGSLDIDNDMYDSASFDWWSDRCGLHHLNPLRVGYFIDKLERSLLDSPSSTDRGREKGGEVERMVLDVGCGAGIATEEIYRRLAKREDGARWKVIGLDPSQRSLAVARDHASQSSPPLPIDYVVGSAYTLPFPSNSIDGIIISDVLEHLYNLPLALSEIHRILKPGGILSFDTINRTPLSFYLSIWMLQDVLKAMQADAHDHRMYVKPEEMERALTDVGMRLGPKRDLVGMRPGLNWPHVSLWRLITGRGFMSSVLAEFKVSDDLSISYLYWASKPHSSSEDDR